ncbi:IQ calmodulin binding motif [Trypanosoma vivax]|nr:hypothetical protein TRVL_03649 [Trypanosoma vivax]KAH8620503.1 IQ calmodulin binding motif [Trypanosoma vivax]
MLGDERLPPIYTQNSSNSPIRKGNGGRLTPLSGTLPLINATRPEAARRLSFQRTQFRQGPYLRMPNETGLSATMSAPFRRLSFDSKKHAMAAASKMEVIVEKFRSQLKAYHTFQPSFVEGGIYSTLLPQTRFHGEPAAERMATLLDVATMKTVRHDAENHFMTMLERFPSIEHRFLSGTTNRESGSDATNTKETSKTVPSSLYSDKYSASMELWLRENSNASAEEIRREQRFYDTERLKSELVGRTRTLANWHAALDSLVGILDKSSLHGPLFSDESTPSKSTSLTKAAEQEQEALWKMFLAGEELEKTSEAPYTGRSNVIITDYKNSDTLHEWFEEKWRHHTHRHEEAALRIQCAYRCYRAKEVTMKRRYGREITFMELLRCEEEARHMWKNAVRLQYEEGGNADGNTDGPPRPVKNIYTQLCALVMKRRSRKEAEKQRKLELENYAAESIQRVYRGYRGRQWVKIMSNKGALMQLHLARINAAAFKLQAHWRGYISRVELCRKIAAAIKIQRLVRSFMAVRKLRNLRFMKRTNADRFTHKFAIQVVIRLLRRCVAWRREYMKDRWEQLFLIQRVGRGRVSRLHAENYLKCKRMAQLCAAIWVQRHFRGAQARALVRRQRVARAELYDEYRRLDAILVIQRAWRRAKELLRRRRREIEEALKLERMRRKLKRARALARRKEAAVKRIEEWYRVVRYVQSVRAERRKEHERLLQLDGAERIIRFYRSCKSREKRTLVNKTGLHAPNC